MLINGQWQAAWQPVQAKDDTGRFLRQTSQFRNWVTRDGAPGPSGHGGFTAEPGRYHLYVALICPWASRTLMVRKLKQLDKLISFSVVEPALTEQGWRFEDHPDALPGLLNGATYVHELYTQVDPAYSGRATVPILWDRKEKTIVNNESADIIRMLNTAFDHLTGSTLNLYPEHLARDIDSLNEQIYTSLNNGVYQAGFASSQQAYEEAYENVFGMLDTLESRFGDGRRFVFGEEITETDIRLFVTLVRFDLAYYGLFKCNRNLLAQMPRLAAYVDRMRAFPGIAETVDETHIKTGYYSIRALNPSGIVPRGPVLTS